MKSVPFKSDWRDSLLGLRSSGSYKFFASEPVRAGWGTQAYGVSDLALEESAAGGNSLAMEWLAARCFRQEPGGESSASGIAWLDLSIKAGNPAAMHWAAERAFSAAGDASEAVGLLERASSAGFLPSKVTLGAYLLEEARPLDTPRAMSLLHEAAAEGSRLAHIVIAVSLLTGRGLAQDRDAGVGWLRRLGATNARKLAGIGSYLYLKSIQAPARERNRLARYAATIFGEAARLGNTESEVDLAYILRREEVDADEFPALDTLLDAHVAAGSAHALMNQALRLARGTDGHTDWAAGDALVARIREPVTLLAWWRARAAEGDGEGHLVVGWLARREARAKSAQIVLGNFLDKARASGWFVPDWMYEVVRP